MWKQRPPLKTPTELANFLGLPKQTTYTWLRMGGIPQAHLLLEISQKTGLSFKKLMEICGYTIPEGFIEVKELIDFIANRLSQEHASYTSDQVIDRIRELEEEYRATQL